MEKREFEKIFALPNKGLTARDRLRFRRRWSNLAAVSVHPVKLDIYRTAIPMRSFEHAAAERDLAEAIIVRLELSDGTVGWGETLPRKYVTGETLETVPVDIENFLWEPVRRSEWEESSVNDMDYQVLPETDPDGRIITAARCAVSLAWIHAFEGRWWRLHRWDARYHFAAIPPSVRVSGVLGSFDPARTAKRLRMMRWFGLRDFKLKLGLGDDIDAENLRIVQKRIGKAIQNGKCTIRVDVNGGWDADQTPDRVAALKPFGVCVVEQPVFGPPEMLIELAQRCELPLMADESLITIADTDRFINATGKKVWLNVRISKNGGLDTVNRIITAADEAGVPFVVGCMVGESGILSSAQRRLLQSPTTPRFVEGNYGKFLLTDDLTRPSLRFAYGGRLKTLGLLSGLYLGVKVSEHKIKRYGTLIKTLHA